MILGNADWGTSKVLWYGKSKGTDRMRARELLEFVVGLTSFPSMHTLWRGQSSIDYHIAPGALRDGSVVSLEDMIEDADNLLRRAADASRRWREWDMYSRLGALHRLALLQHHRNSTPLLDVTPDPMIALWFACRTSSGSGLSQDGILIAFNVDKRWVPLDREGAETVKDALAGLGAGQVGWFRPPNIADRIVAQRGAMIIGYPAPSDGWEVGFSRIRLPRPAKIHMTASESEADRRLRSVATPGRGQPWRLPIVGIRVPFKLKAHLLRHMDGQFGISSESVFPDPHGFAEGK